MERKRGTKVAGCGRREVVAADRIARRIEARCRRRVPDCRVVTVLDGPGRSIGLRIGSHGDAPGEQLWVLELDVDCLSTAKALDDLARVISVWIEPQASAEKHARDRLAARG